MRHQRSGKKLGRDSAHRKALYANLAGALIEHGRIKTTATKAKAVKPIAEQMITLARRGDMHARRRAVAYLRSKDVVHKLFSEIGPLFAERPGGYSRIVKLGPRPGDSAEMVYLELVDTPLVLKTRLPREDEEPAAAVIDQPQADAEDAEHEAAVETEPAEAEAAAGEPAEDQSATEPEAAAAPPDSESDDERAPKS